MNEQSPLTPPAALALLSDRYPTIARRLPLALGTRQRLAAEREEHGLSTRLTQRAIKILVGSTPYLKAVAADGARRWTLDGEPAEAIDPATAAAALKEVRRRMQSAAEQKRAKAPPPKAKAEPAPEPPKAPLPPAPPPPPQINLAALGRPRLTLKNRTTAQADTASVNS
jgi:sRNA-binding protein